MISMIGNSIRLLFTPRFHLLIVEEAVILAAVWLDARSKGART